MPADKLILDRLDHAGYVDLFNCYRIVAGMVPEAPAPGLELDRHSGPLLEWSRGRASMALDCDGLLRKAGFDCPEVGAPLHEHAAIADALRRLFELA